MPSQVLKRVSIRWLPEPAYEDTQTVALNVGGYFIDLRVQNSDGAIQWSRAGERRILKASPLTCEWTHIIDSLSLTEPDVASFETMPNGDELETGRFKNPNNGGALTDYEEVWRDVTNSFVSSHEETHHRAWILQSADGSTFLGMLAGLYLAIGLSEDGGFGARREERVGLGEGWKTIFQSTQSGQLQDATSISSGTLRQIEDSAVGETVEFGGMKYVIRALEEYRK